MTTCGDWFRRPLRERVQHDPDDDVGDYLDSLVELLVADVALLRREYDSLATTEERFYLLFSLSFGARVFGEGGAGSQEFVDWLARVDVGDAELQARFLARAFEVGGLEWNRIHFNSWHFTLDSRMIAGYVAWLQAQTSAGKSPIVDLDPFGPDLPPADVVIVEQALRDGDPLLWHALDKDLPSEIALELRRAHELSSGSQDFAFIGPSVPEPGGVLRNLWQTVRTVGPEKVALMPGFWTVRARLRTDSTWLMNLYAGATTPEERYWALGVAGFGACFFESPRWALSSPKDPDRVRKWLGGLDLGDAELQARFRAWTFRSGNRLRTRWAFDSGWCTVTEHDLVDYATWLTGRYESGADLSEEIDPRAAALPSAGACVVDRAVRDQRRDVWDRLQHLLPQGCYTTLLDSMYPQA